jgi:hypothetical protein
MTDASPRRLPVELVVKRSFLYAWESRETLAAPFIIYASVWVLAELLNIAAGSKSFATLFLVAAEQIFAVAFAVGLNRFVLLGEVRNGFQFFRWDRHFVQYLLVTFLLLILAMMAALIVIGAVGTDAAGGTAEPNAAGALFGLAVMLGVALVLSRIALSLPAAALGEQKRPREIWQATEGNSFRLLAAALLTALPFLVVEAALSRLMPGQGNIVVEFLMTVAQALLASVQLIVVTVMLSLSYDVLIRGGGPAK